MTDLATNVHHGASTSVPARGRGRGRGTGFGRPHGSSYAPEIIDDSTVSRKPLTPRSSQPRNPWAPDPALVSDSPEQPLWLDSVEHLDQGFPEATIRVVSSLPGSRTLPSVGVSRSEGAQDRQAVRAALIDRDAPRPVPGPPLPPTSAKSPLSAQSPSSADLTTPVTSAEPEVLAEPEAPAEPGVLTEPEAPVETEAPAKSVAPANSEILLTPVRRRRRGALVLVALLGILVGVGVALYAAGPLNSKSVEDIAVHYGKAISSGDAKDVMNLMSGERTTQDWLPTGAYATAASRPAGLTVDHIDIHGNSATVTLSDTSKRLPGQHTLNLSKHQEGPFGLRTTWRITSGLEQPVTVSIQTRASNANIGELSVNGQPLENMQSGKPTATMWALPGTYIIEPPQEERYFTFGNQRMVIVGNQEDQLGGATSGAQTLTFRERSTAALLDDASQLAESFVASCLNQLAAQECPNVAEGLPVDMSTVVDFQWDLLSYRYALNDDGTALNFTGEFELTYTFEERNRFTSPTNPALQFTRTAWFGTEKSWNISVSRTRDGITLS